MAKYVEEHEDLDNVMNNASNAIMINSGAKYGCLRISSHP